MTINTLKPGNQTPKILPAPNTRSQAEPALTILEAPEDQATRRDTRSPHPEDFHPALNPDGHPNDTVPNVSSDNHEIDPSVQNSPRKNKYNLRADPH